MKGGKFKILVLSILLLTLSSGLLFYKNLFLIDSPGNGGKIDFEELRYTDLQINNTMVQIRKNMSTDFTILDKEIDRLKELLNIVNDINKNNPELNQSILKLQKYFTNKIESSNSFKTSIIDLKKSITQQPQNLAELAKNNIKFSVDKKDFYQESLTDVLMYLSLFDKFYEEKLSEDKKILGQILSFANSPNPLIQKFANNLDNIIKLNKRIDSTILLLNNDQLISSEMLVVGKFYRDSQATKTHDGEVYLSMIFGAIVLYLILVVVILRKLG